ncbi:two-component system, response regulator YesN [Paenibacillus polysaccharolyticus]|uniref:Two-component system, response regulator YesN n=1 Tax=Paenibacillus polysaccharolyticus TaxID=582692 RepID=A0A1G5K360_9BACL|nr:response regulator [Paenibacillus polysaccharolyticus]SCY94894.1 two-component system, response regulator YesN [Paenibacillus polysaccharolyticus]
MSKEIYRVLLVDDEPWNRDILRNLGEWDELGLVVCGEAEDGEQAIQMVKTLQPHLIITDMRMPGSDGVELMQTLSSQYPEIKVVVVSGYDDFNYAKHALRYRAADYLLKPVNPDELNATLAKCSHELDKAATAPEVWEAYPASFAGEFSLFQQQARLRFNDLNLTSLREWFHQLEQKLEQNEVRRPRQLGRAVYELQNILDELCVSNGLFDRPEEGLLPPAAALGSIRAAVEWISASYYQALEQLIAQRKYKNKLNLEEVKQYMQQHCMEMITLEQLAQIFFVSKEYLSKAFKKEYDVNVTDYVVQLRMTKAKEWVMDDQIPFKHIAEMTGYEDVSYFYRVFKKHFGVSPGEMRKGQHKLPNPFPE